MTKNSDFFHKKPMASKETCLEPSKEKFQFVFSNLWWLQKVLLGVKEGLCNKQLQKKGTQACEWQPVKLKYRNISFVYLDNISTSSQRGYPIQNDMYITKWSQLNKLKIKNQTSTVNTFLQLFHRTNQLSSNLKLRSK